MSTLGADATVCGLTTNVGKPHENRWPAAPRVHTTKQCNHVFPWHILCGRFLHYHRCFCVTIPPLVGTLSSSSRSSSCISLPIFHRRTTCLLPVHSLVLRIVPHWPSVPAIVRFMISRRHAAVSQAALHAHLPAAVLLRVQSIEVYHQARGSGSCSNSASSSISTRACLPLRHLLYRVGGDYCLVS